MAIPEYMKPDQEVIDDIEWWFDKYELTYRGVWAQLDRINRLWREEYSKEEKIAVLKLSYLNSVFSIRAPVPIHEAAFQNVMNGDTLEMAFERAGLGLSLYVDIYGNIRGKIEKIRDALSDDEIWGEVVGMLDAGQIDAAHHRLLDMPFLGDAKAPFTLANLGFTQKMCIDANVMRLFEIDKVEGLSVEEYEGVCADIKDMFPELYERVERAYHLQWVIFDYVRFHRTDSGGNIVKDDDAESQRVAQHRVWFDSVLGDIDRVVRITERMTRRANELQDVEQDTESGIKDYFGQIDFRELEKQIRDDIRQDINEDLREQFGGEPIEEDRIRQEVKRGIEEAIESADGWDLESVAI